MHASIWSFLGGLSGGAVWSLAIAPLCAPAVFACTQAGLYRSSGSSPVNVQGWERLPNAAVDVTSVALAPDFERNRSLWIGAQGGILASFDGGNTWHSGVIPRPATRVTALSASPDFARDGVVLAATMDDGVLRTEDSGLHWHAWNFGLFDPSVFSLAISPDFARDGTAFAGTARGLFSSHNSGRSWRELDFPQDAPPVLSLGLSPDFARDGMIFAGTEVGGLYRSHDRGKTWLALTSNLLASCINALAISPRFAQDRTVVAATENGVYRSTDGGQRWASLGDLSDVMCLAMNEALTVAGAVDGGVYQMEGIPGKR